MSVMITVVGLALAVGPIMVAVAIATKSATGPAQRRLGNFFRCAADATDYNYVWV
jgi:hypothetical protein